jgi:hypothetical protein
MTVMDDRDAPEELQSPDHAASILGIALGCASYAFAHRFAPPMVHYLPEIGEWSTDPPPELIAMSYFGVVPYGLLGFVVGWAIAKIPGVGPWLHTQGARKLTAAATAAIAGALLYHVAFELAGHAS